MKNNLAASEWCHDGEEESEREEAEEGEKGRVRGEALLVTIISFSHLRHPMKTEDNDHFSLVADSYLSFHERILNCYTTLSEKAENTASVLL